MSTVSFNKYPPGSASSEKPKRTRRTKAEMAAARAALAAPIKSESEGYAATMHYQRLRELAELKLGMEFSNFQAIHMNVAQGREEMARPVLTELETKLLQLVALKHADDLATDAATDVAQIADDIFGAFGVEDMPEPEPAEVPAAPEEDQPSNEPLLTCGYYVAFNKEGDTIWGASTAKDAALVEARQSWQDFYGRPEQNEIWVAKATECLYDQVLKYGGCVADWKPNGWCLENGVATFCNVIGDEDADSPKPGTAVGSSDTSTVEPMISGDALAAEDQDRPAVTSMTEEAQPVETDQGLIDPDTGEVLEPSFILRKFGWTEMPALGKDPTHEELAHFEAQLDQLVDKVLSHQERTARYRAACEQRCKPYDEAAKFWTEQFLVPLSKQLAPYRLRKNAKGEYKGKTLTLNSGCVKFVKSGGAFVHDAELVKQHIQEVGLSAFAAVGARTVVQYNYPKLISALNKGVLKDIPGTGIEPMDEFARVKVVTPKASVTEPKEESENA